MLIITRRIGETFVIGEGGDIKITVLGIKGNQVCFGTEAPKEISIYREKIYQTMIKNSNVEKEVNNEQGKF